MSISNRYQIDFNKYSHLSICSNDIELMMVEVLLPATIQNNNSIQKHFYCLLIPFAEMICEVEALVSCTKAVYNVMILSEKCIV